MYLLAAIFGIFRKTPQPEGAGEEGREVMAVAQ
jgi:hypothetical protein